MRLLAAMPGKLGRSAERVALLGALGVIAERGPLETHSWCWADIRRRHVRNVSFWAYVNGMRRVESVAEINDDDEP